MNVIVDFLQNTAPLNESLYDMSVEMSEIEEVKVLFRNAHVELGRLAMTAQKHEGQIWTVKSRYYDYQGCLQQTNRPYMVLLRSEVEMVNGVAVARACPISPFVDMAAHEDLVCKEEDIVGFPFLLEEWNEQPVLTELLDVLIGNCADSVFEKKTCITSDQADVEAFRDAEVRLAAYLSHSVVSLLEYYESTQNRCALDVMGGTTAKTVYLNEKLADGFRRGKYQAYAAKAGNNSGDQKKITVADWNLPYQLELRKREEGHVITISPVGPVTLVNQDGIELKAAVADNRMVYYPIAKGLYRISDGNNRQSQEIRIK